MELDLFTKNSLTEMLGLSEDVSFGGTWEVTSANPAIAAGAGNVVMAGPGQEAGFQLTVMGNGVGTTVLTVTYRLGSDVYTLDITVNVTARLELRPKEGKAEVFTNGAVEIQLLPYGRRWNLEEAQPVLDLAAQNIIVSFQPDSVNHDEHKTAAIEQRAEGIFLKLASDGTAGVSSVSLGYQYSYGDRTYTAISAVPVTATAPGILPAEPVIKAGNSENITVTFANSEGKTAVIDAVLSVESKESSVAAAAVAGDAGQTGGSVSLAVTGVAAGETSIVLKVSLTMDERKHDVEVTVPVKVTD